MKLLTIIVQNYIIEQCEDLFPSTAVTNEGSTVYKSPFVGLDDKPYATKCPLCDVKFMLPENEKDLLTHLFKIHRLVIGDVWNIASLKRFDLFSINWTKTSRLHIRLEINIYNVPRYFQLCTLLGS